MTCFEMRPTVTNVRQSVIHFASCFDGFVNQIGLQISLFYQIRFRFVYFKYICSGELCLLIMFSFDFSSRRHCSSTTAKSIGLIAQIKIINIVLL